MFADSDVYRGLAKRMNDTGLVEDNRNVEMGVSVHALKGVHIKIALFPLFVLFNLEPRKICPTSLPLIVLY